MALKARAASRKLQTMTTDERVAMLNRVADALVANEEMIMEENAKVRERSMDRKGAASRTNLLVLPFDLVHVLVHL